MLCDRDPAEHHVAELRELARCGALVAAVSAAGPQRRNVLVGAAYAVAWPVVFARLTRALELRRGHQTCASSVERMADDCLDRFEDDVEAVVADVIAHAAKPIRNLEAWIAARLTAVTVDAHRRQRGSRGALQRPRLPKWLSEALAQDAWLSDLALQVLTWVGVPATAGTGLWPLDSWAQRRAELTGDWAGSDTSLVAREVDRILVAMRSHERWYTDHVERPLGRKRAPLVPPVPGQDDRREPAALPLVQAHELEDAWLTGLALEAVEAIANRLRRGENPRTVVVDVIGRLFGGCRRDDDIERLPHNGSGYDERLDALMRDPVEVDRIVGDVLRVIDPRDADRLVPSR